ncbi:hypothetical protein NEUTE1DRAFT_108344 [Neurospora tetrasperma FGSC 2508]|uniref:Uncharacterized protein n=1 Tax=Neurospora tetrasperma (strain FGSC 2508 / ATCC MYA-4615 / P0657) TaxID=510951 RepID=F8MH94_NEUT8|nr:uncharacterized protein NEUTE1DRAFT_108344 [Neurospora tetrasperma FGSC 2508]EGO58759.1 hypothetical protein NEUTE1DRAFT_108344 [Neurospora tetrasperma FGSC 2508]EGZ72853.1 hypothetical protein NEUTE2DRAFT_137274 [Neurospora tetrasperma FGSC 2509]
MPYKKEFLVRTVYVLKLQFNEGYIVLKGRLQNKGKGAISEGVGAATWSEVLEIHYYSSTSFSSSTREAYVLAYALVRGLALERVRTLVREFKGWESKRIFRAASLHRFNVQVTPYNTSEGIYSNTTILIVKFKSRRVFALIVVIFLDTYGRYTIVASGCNEFVDITIAIKKVASSSRYIEEPVFDSQIAFSTSPKLFRVLA